MIGKVSHAQGKRIEQGAIAILYQALNINNTSELGNKTARRCGIKCKRKSSAPDHVIPNKRQMRKRSIAWKQRSQPNTNTQSETFNVHQPRFLGRVDGYAALYSMGPNLEILTQD